MAVIDTIAISYISIHTAIFILTFVLIARSNLPDDTKICSKTFLNKLRETFTQRPTLAAFSILHFVDVGFDFGVMFGWYFDQNTFRSIISYNGSLLLFILILHLISKITSSVYIYGVTRNLLPTILQFFDLEIYYEMYFDQHCTEMNMDIKIEQLYRSFAVMQSFPIAIIQTYLLVSYDRDEFIYKNSNDFIYISFTFLSLLSSILFIISLSINHDSKFLKSPMDDKWMHIGMPKWLIRVLFRTFELLSRILLLVYLWVLFPQIGIYIIIIILTIEWIFQIYNHYKKERYDNSSEHSIRMWRKQNKFFLWPIVMDELITFWNFDWKISGNNQKQRLFDIIDIFQCWTIASYLYGNKTIRKLTNERPQCDCKRTMDEYWTTNFEPIATTNENYEKPKCASCNQYVTIKSHYFRCPTFLQSGNFNEKITKHGRYLCIECGYARMTYIPFLFIFSRNIFTCIYIIIFTIINYNNIYLLLFIFGICCHILYPIFFILILTTKQMKLRKIELKKFTGKVIEYASNFEWNKVYELIRHEECDVNEVDRIGRSSLLYAAISHNFQVIRDLQQFGADMNHCDINSCNVTNYLNNAIDIDDSKDDKLLTGPTRAVKNGSEEDIYLCIELGCNLNKKDGYGHTALLIACKEREKNILKILINESNKYGNNKVNLNISDKLGRNAIIIVTQYGYDDLLQILINESNKNNINILHQDNNGLTAFQHAINCNQKKCAKLIHQYKKKYNIINENENENENDTQMNNIQLPNDDLQGDEKKHPIGAMNTSISGVNTPSQLIELHESDSIDRRMIRALTVERNQLQNYNMNDINHNNKKKIISIVVTDTSAEH